MLNSYIKSLIQNFKRGDFKDFISYFYFTMDNKINSIKQESIKNKYIKIREDVLKYIIANERAITSEIRKSKNK